MKGQGPFPQPPMCLAFILAHDVSYGVETKVLSIVAPYSTLSVEQLPITLISIQAYIVLTACDGDVMVELQMVDANQDRPPVFRQFVSTSFVDTQEVREVIFHQFHVTVPVKGQYRFLLTVYRADFSYPEFVMERRVEISELPPTEESAE
jgi:hypothetical protein